MSSIKPTIKSEFFPLVILAAGFAASAYFYENFPEVVPTHWNFAGQADGWSGKASAAFAIPTLNSVIYLMFFALPYLDPKKDRYEQFAKVYHIFKSIILFLLLAIYFAVGLSGLGYNVPIGTITPILIGIMFVVMGNYMGKLKPNWFMGIRTPWTLSSEKIWNKTHRFGGKIFILSGLLMIMQPFLHLSLKLPVFIISICLMLFGTVGYSFILYLKSK